MDNRNYTGRNIETVIKSMKFTVVFIFPIQRTQQLRSTQ
ncbi:Hypothetical protein CpOVID04_0061 [Corynebacterium pseudotuberculosis]|nr:Hypothetical protein CpCAP1R_0061 [Corynebacterium pseudotuberculosis]QDL39963.1 Hypothetical protein CpOVID04_0061 [Corynebacterium pseudotuberculosis]QDL42068.1 Hypothetical protein CpOVIZ01_0061 [Corynebacterium pseudotuberculosis]